MAEDIVILNGELIKKIIARKNISKKDLSTLLGRSQSYVSTTERAGWRTTAKTLPAWSYVLGVPQDELLLNNDKRSQKEEPKAIHNRYCRQGETFEEAVLRKMTALYVAMTNLKDKVDCIETDVKAIKAFEKEVWGSGSKERG